MSALPPSSPAQSTAPSPTPPPRGLELAPGIRIDPALLKLQYARSSGPGGQNVNKVNTKTELWAPVAALAGLTRIIHPLPCANGLRVVNCFYHEELTNTGGHGWWRRVLSS